MKQYLLIAAPLVLLLIPRDVERRERVRWLVKAVVTTAVVTLPLMLVNVPNFI